MATPNTPQASARSVNPEAGHDTRDVQVRGILLFAVILAVFTGLVMYGLSLMIGYYQGRARSDDLSRPERFADPTDQFPPPVLQGDPATDTAHMRRDDEKVLTSYGWTDPKAHIARIPLERAMDIIAAKGLPSRALLASPSTEAPPMAPPSPLPFAR